MKSFIREKTIYCSDKYKEVDIYPYTMSQKQAANRTRSRKKNVTTPKQKNLNDKNARRYLVQLGNSNFGENDLHVTCTYTCENLPKTIDDADREVRNYIRRLSYRREKKKISPLKYILVTAYSHQKNTETPVRIHHHLIINGGLSRDTVESLWRRRKKKGETVGSSIGYVNADRLQPDENGVAALCTYLAKNVGGKKRWTSSQNLKKPQSRTNDFKYSRRKLEAAAKNEHEREFWEKMYPGWTLTTDDYGMKAMYSDYTGWSVYLKLRKKE